jgi:hypothetical protein
MKQFTFFSIFSIALFANCNYINDADLKNLCFAETTNAPQKCYYIRDKDKKNYCLALTKRKKDTCNYIKNSDLKNYCKAKIK